MLETGYLKRRKNEKYIENLVILKEELLLQCLLKFNNIECDDHKTLIFFQILSQFT